MAIILIIEDDQFLRKFYQELLQGERFLVEGSPDYRGDFIRMMYRRLYSA